MADRPSNGGQIRRLTVFLREHGYAVMMGKSGHYHVVNAQRKHVYSFAGSPSCPHFASNTVRHMMQLGLLPESVRGVRIR